MEEGDAGELPADTKSESTIATRSEPSANWNRDEAGASASTPRHHEIATSPHPDITTSQHHHMQLSEWLVRSEGLEPPAYRFEACRSIQLSYERMMWARTKCAALSARERRKF